MIRVRTASRLHFGLFNTAGLADPGPLGLRQFGGVGLMVQQPGVRLAVEPAASWSAEGPLAARALEFARRFASTLPADALPPQRVVVEQAAPEHTGLGTGTQLALAVARALTAAGGGEPGNAADLARRVGRGRRSALGVWGFLQGGFLVEAGQRQLGQLGALVARAAFPEQWRIVLVLPPCGPGLHGGRERAVFAELEQQPPDLAGTDRLCRLVLLGMLPALAEEDVETFGESVYEFNVRAGEVFAPMQGGRYAAPLVAEVVHLARRLGVRGVGQSSWGPAVFAVVGDPEHAATLAQRLRQQLGPGADDVVITQAENRGALLR